VLDVGARVDAREDPHELGPRDRLHDHDVEEAVVEPGVRGHAHAAAVRRPVADGDEHRRRRPHLDACALTARLGAAAVRRHGAVQLDRVGAGPEHRQLP
jgi:hypothetical protein